MTVQRPHTSHGKEPNVETHRLFRLVFVLARGKYAKMSGQTPGPLNIHKKTRFLT